MKIEMFLMSITIMFYVIASGYIIYLIYKIWCTERLNKQLDDFNKDVKEWEE